MKKNNYVVPSRIAINLYDMNGELGRVDGGMGFSLEYPRLVFDIEKSESINIINKQLLGEELSTEVERVLNQIKKEDGLTGANIDVSEAIPIHSGFGSKTATLLSTVYALGKLNGKEYDFRDIAVRVHRGGTSGLGANIIDKGGFILEGGHSTKYKKVFQPSSAIKEIKIAPILAQYKFPDWDILIVIPQTERIYGMKEKTVFQEICPIPSNDVEKIARATLSQCLPAIVEEDLETFCSGIETIQEGVWKKGEIDQYDGEIRKVMDYLKKNGARGAGMSSMGPGIYAFGNDLSSLARKLENNKDFKLDSVFVTKANNLGLYERELK